MTSSSPRVGGANHQNRQNRQNQVQGAVRGTQARLKPDSVHGDVRYTYLRYSTKPRSVTTSLTTCFGNSRACHHVANAACRRAYHPSPRCLASTCLDISVSSTINLARRPKFPSLDCLSQISHNHSRHLNNQHLSIFLSRWACRRADTTILCCLSTEAAPVSRKSVSHKQ